MIKYKDKLKIDLPGWRKAQSFLEYSFLAVVCVGSLIIMINYFNRSVQGKLKESIDSVGKEFIGGRPAMPESNFRVSSVGQEVPRGDLFVGSSGKVDKTTTGFTYEGKKGFVVSLRHYKRNEVATIGEYNENEN